MTNPQKENFQKFICCRVIEDESGKVEFVCYSLQNLLVSKIHSLVVASCCKIDSLLVAKVDSGKKSITTFCKIHSLLVAEVAPCKNLLVTRCKNSLITRYKIHSL